MSETTKIEWADSTFNPWAGCTKVSPGCDHCYAEGWAKRSGAVQWGPHAERHRTTAANWRKPLQWDRDHEAFEAEHGRRRRVFCASLADVFDNAVSHDWRRDLFELIGRTQHLDWLLLTKRIGNARAMLNAVVEEMSHGLNTWDERPWPGVWIGATVVNQHEADRGIPKLLQVPARVRFLSIEPMLGPIELGGWLKVHKHWESADSLAAAPWHPSYPSHWYERQAVVPVGWMPPLHWVICGGESGPGARPTHPDWARSLRDQCEAAGVPFLFKQWGEWGPTNMEANRDVLDYIDPDGNDAVYGSSVVIGLAKDGQAYEQVWPVIKVGKKAAGRLLDGITHDGFHHHEDPHHHLGPAPLRPRAVPVHLA